MASLTCEITWVLQLLKDLKIEHPKLAMLFCDNEAALYIVANPIFMRGLNILKWIATWFETRFWKG